MFIVFSSSSDIFQRVSYMQTSMPADTHNPFLIPVFPVSSTTVLYVLNGLPLQFIVMWENMYGVRSNSICSCTLSSTIWHGTQWVLHRLLQSSVFRRLDNASFQAGSTILIGFYAEFSNIMIDTDADPPRFPLYSIRRKGLSFSQRWKWNRKHWSSIPPEVFHPFLLFMKLSINSFFFVSGDITRSLFSKYSMTYHLSAGTVCSHQDGPLPRPSFCFPSTWIPYYEGVSFILLPLDTQNTCISGALLESSMLKRTILVPSKKVRSDFSDWTILTNYVRLPGAPQIHKENLFRRHQQRPFGLLRYLCRLRNQLQQKKQKYIHGLNLKFRLNSSMAFSNSAASPLVSVPNSFPSSVFFLVLDSSTRESSSLLKLFWPLIERSFS